MLLARHLAGSRLLRACVGLCLVIAAAHAGALDPQQPLRQLGQQIWQTDDGLPQNTVHAIAQSGDGFLWLATDGGLVRFDGVDFTLFDRHAMPQMRSNLIGALATTPDGTLWAATADGLLRRSHGRLAVLSTAEGLPAGPIADVLPAANDQVWVLTPEAVLYGQRHFSRVAGAAPLLTGRDGLPIAARAGDGTLWIATARGLQQLREGRVVTTLPVTADLLAVAPDESLWIAAANTLYRRDGAAMRSVALPAGMLPLRALLAGGSGRVYAGGAGGLAILSGDRVTFRGSADGLPAGRMRALFEDRRGALWLSTETSTVRYANDRFERLHPQSGKEAAGVTTFSPDAYLEDREGNLWFGTESSGLMELRPQRFSTLTAADGLPGESIRTLLAARNGSVWAGTDGAGLAHQQGAGWHAYTADQGLASNTILSLAEEKDGALAVGTPDGLDRLQQNHAVPAPATDALPDDFVRSLLTDSTGALWIGTRRGLARRSEGRLQQWSRANGLGSDLVGALAEDRAHLGALWVGTRGGLSHVDASTVRSYTQHDGLSSEVVTSLYADETGTLWIGTNGGGLNLLRDGRIVPVPANTGLPEVVLSILEDNRGALWLASTSGIFLVSRRDAESFALHRLSHLDVAQYGVADGMRIAECSSGHPAAVRTADGSLWFATLRGISVTDPEHTENNRLPPPVAIENVTVDDLAVPTTDRVRIGPEHTRLSVHYAGLSFVAPARVRYRYRLEGFDPNWVEAQGRRVAYYTNVPPGRYTFRVLAANNDGIWNDTGASLQIQVLPHTWETWWFRTLFVLFVLFAAYQVYRLRVRTVEARFAAVLAERNRIAREIHDTLAQDIVGISVQLELVSRLLSSSVDAARTQLDAARQLVKSSLTEARSSIWNLRSASAGADDLPARVNRAATQAVARGTAKLRFEVRGTYRAAPVAVEDQVVRVAQEAVANGVRHSAASRIEVKLAYDTRALELSIEDDGQGFRYDPAALVRGGHFGLAGMRERAAEVGGTLTVESEPAKGTRIRLRVEIP